MNFARRVALVAAVALGLSACTEVTQEPMPEQLQFATFASPNIPTPNDLALAAVPTLPASAQKELLQAFVNAGGWPYDQEVSITIPFSAKRWNAASSAYEADAAPAVDAASVTTGTVVLYKLGAAGAAPTPVEYDAIVSTPGRLVLRKKADATGSRRWEPGARYFVAVRGGGSGVKAGGKAFSADSAVALAIPNRDLTKKENQPLGAIPDASNPPNGNADEIRSLEGVRNQLWNIAAWGTVPCPAPLTGSCWGPTAPGAGPAHVLPFPVEELATFAAFTVASAGAAGPVVLIDAGSGVAPLPIDLLRTGPNGTIANNPAFGAAAGGLATLDGFSTTAMMLAQTSGPIDASTVNGANILVYAISGATSDAVASRTATMVPELKATLGGGGNGNTAGYVAQPSALVSTTGCPIAGGCSVAIGLQPAVPAAVPGVGNFWLPPLRSNTHYAVVVTSRVKGVTGAALVKSTVAKIILDFTNAPATGTPGDATGVSLLSGVSDETARALRDIRANLEPVWAANPTLKADTVTAYTFKTQSVPNVSLSLGSAPYGIEVGANQPIFAATAAPTPVTPPAGVPTTGVAGFYNVRFNSLDLIDKNTGAFRATLATDLTNPATVASLVTNLNALVAVPNAANVPACPAGFPPGTQCAKVVVFGHGLNGSKETMFAVASGLAQAGFIAAAIDFPLHGGRNWCNSDDDCTTDGTTGNGTCDKAGAFAGSLGQGDGSEAARPGVCSNGSVPLLAASRYFVSANFFRTRDAFRQNVFDQSALTLAMSRPPTGVPQIPTPPGNPISAIVALPVIVDPTAIFYEGISLGSISGTQVVATMPRITRASLSVGGGTVTDVFTNSPAFQAGVDALFAQLIPGYSRAAITPGDPAFDPAIAAAYLTTLNVAKWILDPGDPINYAQHVKLAPLPNLLANPDGSVPQAAKAAYGQIAKNDSVVPNPFNFLLYNVMGADQTFYDSATAAGGSVPHSMLATTPQVQQDAAGYLLGVVPPAARTLP